MKEGNELKERKKDEHNPGDLADTVMLLLVSFPRVLTLSCHVIVRNHLSLSMGSWSVAAGANPSLVVERGSFDFFTGKKKNVSL